MKPIEIVLWNGFDDIGANGRVYSEEVIKKALTSFSQRVQTGAVVGEAKTLEDYRNTRDFNDNPAKQAFKFVGAEFVGDSNNMQFVATILPEGPRAELLQSGSEHTFAIRGTRGADTFNVLTWDLIVPSCALTEVIDK